MPFACSIAARFSAISATASVMILRADHLAGVVVHAFAYDADLARGALHGDDAVPGAERLQRPADVLEGRRDLFLVVRVLAREHQASRRGD